MLNTRIFKTSVAVIVTVFVALFSFTAVYAEPDSDNTSPSGGYTEEITDPPTEEQTEPVTDSEPETEPVTDEETQATTQQQTQEQTQPETTEEQHSSEVQTTTQETQTQEKTEYVQSATEENTYDDMLPTVDKDSLQLPTAVGSHIENPAVNATAGIVSWICTGLGVVVILAVLFSTKSSERKNGGKQRYGRGDKITRRKPPVEY